MLVALILFLLLLAIFGGIFVTKFLLIVLVAVFILALFEARARRQ